MKNLGKPLNEAEFEELEAFLESDTVPEECLDISCLDGYLTALVVGPETFMPSQWLPVVWGEAEDDEMVWDSPEQAERITGLIMRLMNSIAAIFQEDPEHFDPLLYSHEVEGEEVTVIEEWCYGFMQGVLLRPEAWEPIFASDEGADLMVVPTLYGTAEGWEKLKEEEESLEEHAKYASLLAPSVLGIFDFWLARREPLVPVTSTKVGRNEPCPCGSGKKFKKCCG